MQLNTGDSHVVDGGEVRTSIAVLQLQRDMNSWPRHQENADAGGPQERETLCNRECGPTAWAVSFKSFIHTGPSFLSRFPSFLFVNWLVSADPVDTTADDRRRKLVKPPKRSCAILRRYLDITSTHPDLGAPPGRRTSACTNVTDVSGCDIAGSKKFGRLLQRPGQAFITGSIGAPHARNERISGRDDQQQAFLSAARCNDHR